MTFTSAQEATFIDGYLGPALAATGLSRVKIIGYDDNWSDPAYPISLLKSEAAPYLSGTAFHCYAGNPTAQTAVHDAAPSKAIWFTECSGGAWSPDFATNLGWDSATLLVGAVQNWAQTVMFWNIALNQDDGPHDGGCTDCTGVVTVNGDQVTDNAEFYELAEANSVVDPGAVRIASPPTQSGVESVAFVNPDHSLAMIIDNSWGNARTITITDGSGVSFSTPLPGGATLALRWKD